MKVTQPADLDGRQLACVYRARLIEESLFAFAHGVGTLRPMSHDAMVALSQVAEELADELMAIRECHVTEANRRHDKEHGVGK